MRLQEKYKKEVISEMKKKFNFKNDLAVPKIEKVVVNIGINASNKDEKVRTTAENTLAKITGQKPVVRLAKKSISAFKIRKGMPVGMSVTLRKKRMYDFVDKLINVALPRVRDFRGLDPKGLDGKGNLNIGFKEHIVFPEIKTDEVDIIHGLEVAIVTSAKDNDQAKELFALIGFPFKKD